MFVIIADFRNAGEKQQLIDERMIVMTTDTELAVNILDMLQACICVIAFGAIVSEVVDWNETKSFRKSILECIPWLLVGSLLICVFEYISNVITSN